MNQAPGQPSSRPSSRPSSQSSSQSSSQASGQLRPIPHGLLQAFRAYESALMSNDLAALDRLFADSRTTLRGDAAGLLVGHDAIAAFRGARGGAPRRRLVQTHVQVIDEDHALIVAVTELERGGRGLQTQLWSRDPIRIEYGGWQVTAAHVSVPAPALDTRIWRVVGDPLLAGAEDGPLAGESVAVKDLYAVAGHPIGAGNPAWLAQARPEPVHAAAVRTLLESGASIRGIARTDEFAYSLAGANVHYGTPPNPKAPYRISGGSSSGSASAVSLGQASIGLGTDTGGSIRVPAAYQGLYGIRTTHGAIDRAGLLPLAPSFDAIGWLTRSADELRAVGGALLPAAGASPTGGRLLAVTGLLELAESSVASTLEEWRTTTGDRFAPTTEHDPILAEQLTDWLTAFTTRQAYEAWQSHGSWLATRLDTVGADVRGRFETAARIDAEQGARAGRAAAEAGARIRDLVGEDIWLLPSTGSVAPATTATPAEVQLARDATLRLTCLAGLGGLPTVSIPLHTGTGLPAGACLLAAPGRDADLLDLAVELATPGLA
ncbi:MAG: DUF3225 domain-containing protein [Nocardioides sp.]|uniref:AtzH-like domain-containing protein n=1 Tax=Nocardioides sp. TaxID=35761 RepID=UPI0039E2AA75